jgi:hypothetical protein
MDKLGYENELTQSLQDLREELGLIDTAIAALTRYREISRPEQNPPARLLRLRVASSTGIRQVEP